MKKLLHEHRQEGKLWIDLLIIIAVFTDWLPSYIQATALGESLRGVSGIVFSGSKLIIAPLLLWDIYKDKKYWFGGFRVPLLCVLIGTWVILPIAFGDSPRMRAQPHIANIVLMFYFCQRRSLRRCELLMQVALLCAALVPLSQIMAHYGLLQPLDASKRGQSVERVFAVTRTGTIGVYSSYCMACLGGILVFRFRNVFLKVLSFPVFSLIVAMALAAPLFTGQRSVALILIAVAGICFINLARYRAALAISITASVVLAAPLLLALMFNQFSEQWYALLDRFGGIDLQNSYLMEDSAYFRIMEFTTIWEEFIDIPDIIGPGVYRFYYVMGNVPHSFVGHLYYDGGICFLLIYSVAVTSLLIRLLHGYLHEQEPEAKRIIGCFATYFVGYFLVSCTMPIMNDRIVGFTIGFSFCLLHAIRQNRLKGQRLRPRHV
ncbi:hypothetical protein N9V19_01300 [Opitutales bacterium]|nr:hypothetical protein [Opitutales bacterium]